jgi:lactoylglutathione lyase
MNLWEGIVSPKEAIAGKENLMKLSHMRLLVTNFDDCFLFYRDVMGFEVAWGELGGQYADFKTDSDVMIAICARQLVTEVVGAQAMPQDVTAQYNSMLIFAVEDVDATAAKIQAKGVPVVAPPQDHPDWGVRTAHFRDPGGNLIEFNRELPH